MQGSKKIPINDINQHITCKICNGYFIDATTIIECLHTFCRSCIVKYLENNKYCPVCDVQVHKTKPLLNIRPDKTIQDIVYKLVPRLYHNEVQRRREFYDGHPEGNPSSLEMSGEAAYQHLLTPEETVCLTLSYHGAGNTLRYLRCPAAVSLGHLKKLIRAKYDLTDNHRVEVLYNQDCLPASHTLMDVAYIYMWKTKGPIELSYKIYECSAKKLKLEPDHPDSASANNNNNNWKEVQLRISESGEMSITGIQDAALSPSILEIVTSDPQKYKNEVVAVVEAKPKPVPPKREPPGLKYIGKAVNASPTTDAGEEVKPDPPVLVNVTSNDISRLEPAGFPTGCATLSSATTTTVFSTINSSKCSTKSEDSVRKEEPGQTDPAEVKMEEEAVTPKEIPKSEPPPVVNNVSDKSLKRKIEEVVAEAEPPVKQPKQTILNHSLGLLNLSNNHPLKKHSKMNRNGESVKEIVLRSTTPINEPLSITPCPKTLPAISKTLVTTPSIDTFPKPNLLNKNLTITQPNRPGTPLVSPKPSMAPAKPVVVPSKPAVSVYAVKSPCYMPKTTYNPIINVPKPVTSISIVKNDAKPPNGAKNDAKGAPGSSIPKIEGKPSNTTSPQQPQQQIINLNNKLSTKAKPSSPIGYKTLRDPPKSWNSQISKANLNKPALDPKYSEMKGVRPAKFFKMRNNMPRYLGNPASGVKPMYQVHISPEKDKVQDVGRAEKTEIRKHSIVKIDPKTLKPISEKAPETTSLSNHGNQPSSNHHLASQSMGSSPLLGPAPSQSDLKINTSSVSIFNPLKLQSSPKNERRSPKSPHSPKLKAQAAGSPTGSKRDKVNLNFTPPNPFVPNLASPTLSPNQFLYPAGPPGFPPYDPRMMAAYHSLWYGQRMAFPASPMPRLSLDLNQQRKNFEMMPSPTSPKMATPSQAAHGPQISTKAATSGAPAASKKPNPPSKKTAKESKGEKSLETTVEKLTQNRNKEMSSRKEPKAQNHNSEKENEDGEKKTAPVCDGGECPSAPAPPPSAAVNSTPSPVAGGSSGACPDKAGPKEEERRGVDSEEAMPEASNTDAASGKEPSPERSKDPGGGEAAVEESK